MGNYFRLVFFAAIVFLLTSASCKKVKPDPSKKEFDRKAMLENIGNDIIMPNYENLVLKLESLNQLTQNFTTAPDAVLHEQCRAAFLEAYKAWQKCSAFEIGPAEQLLLRANVNTFPVDTSKVNSSVRSGNYNLQTASNLTAKGFPAIDYLLFYPGSAPENLTLYTSDSDAQNRKNYLKTVVSEILNGAKTVNNQWKGSGGNYIATFSTSMGNDVGSSIGMLVNQFNYDYEITKTNKVGIPLGKKSLGSPYPEKVEAYYSGKSLELLKEHVYAIENLYLGRNSIGENKSGFDDYLNHLEAKHNDRFLDAAIKDQFTAIKASLSSAPDPMSKAIVDNASAVNSAYIEIQKMVVFLKTDLPSALGVLITFQDNDGD